MNSLRIARVKGISLELHSTFLLFIIAIAAFLAIFEPESLAPTMLLLFFLFLSVLLHELSHSLVALSKGFKIERIILLPIGGIAAAEELPEKPKDELLIALAGPFFNFALAFLIIFIAYFALPGLNLLPPVKALQNPANLENLLNQYPLFSLLWVNVILGAFNLFVPALPMDGGRVLRALLAFRMNFEKATFVATRISIFLAIAMFIFGLLVGNFWLWIIAVFVWIGANAEMQSASLKQALRPVNYEKVINQSPKAFSGLLNLEEAFEKMREKNQVEVLVELESGFGFVSAEMLSRVKRALWFETRLADIAAKLPIMLASSPADKLFQTIQSTGIPFVIIVKNRQFFGIVSEKDLQKLYRLEKAEQTS
ncbi:MAG: site-2 protease family protein [Candidatus Diapherotrites archaeon]|uniref:Zinc metalloprotease n=2 Tax=Candidatus Iainarchaeum sp. TaxID=3101447 RepID=A0A8T4L441_9ARCH|nr:site-2 protease family protein [Candidatus Diapherotrites archaeon]